MPEWLPIVLILAGLACVVGEVFFPSMGLLGTLAAGSMVLGLILAYQVSAGYFAGLLIAVLVLLPAVWFGALRVLPKTPFGRELLLSGPRFDANEARGTQAGLIRFEGGVGKAASMLRPSGVADIKGERVAVITRGELIAKGRSIRVVEVSSNRVIVEAIPEARDEEAPLD